MPTDPIPGILDRDRSVDAASELIDVACPLLRELVHLSTHVIRRAETGASDENDVDLPAFILFRQVVEFTDGVEVLLSRSAVTPAVPLLRGSLEASLELGYLTERNYRRRALSWVYCNARHRIRRMEGYDPQTEKGREYWEKWKEELGHAPNFGSDDVGGSGGGVQKFVEQERFEEIREEYESFGREPDWYQLFGGPGNRRQLAERVGRRTEYDTLYRIWSDVVHAQMLAPYLSGQRHEGEAVAHPLRYGRHIPNMATSAAQLAMRAIDDMLGHFRPAETWRPMSDDWVAERFNRLTKIEVREEIGEVHTRS